MCAAVKAIVIGDRAPKSLARDHADNTMNTSLLC